MKSFWLKSTLTGVVLFGSTVEGLVVVSFSDVEERKQTLLAVLSS
jgi:hypothetical protein